MSIPSPAEIAAAGPWAVLVFALLVGIVVGWTVWVKDILVSGKRLKQSERRNVQLEAELRKVSRERERDASIVMQAARIIARRKAADDDRAGSDPEGFHD